MKGLLYKDLCVLRKQMWSFLLMIVIFCLIPSSSVLNLGLFFIIYTSLLPITLMSYDERAQWDRLAPMLPYTTRTVVLSKYVLAWGLTLSTGGLYLLGRMFRPEYARRDVLTSFFFALAASLLLQAILYPILFRVGVEKGRLMMILISTVVAALLAGAAVSVGGAVIFTLPVQVLAPVALAAAAVVSVASIPVAARQYTRRGA